MKADLREALKEGGLSTVFYLIVQTSKINNLLDNPTFYPIVTFVLPSNHVVIVS